MRTQTASSSSRRSDSPQWRWWLAAGTALVAVLAYLSARRGGPAPDAPFGAAVVVPMLVLSAFRVGSPIAGVVPVALAYVAWAWPREGEEGIPLRSRTLFVATALLSALFFASSWSHGVMCQGQSHTLRMALCNLACLVATGALLLADRREKSVASAYLFHVVLFGWLAWCAFPWLGELF